MDKFQTRSEYTVHNDFNRIAIKAPSFQFGDFFVIIDFFISQNHSVHD